MYDFDYNAILAEPIKSRKTKHLIKGFTSCHKRITASGITPILLRLDNKISGDLIAVIHSKNLKYQLANAYDHRHNLAERTIQTFKAQFISILNGCDAHFPTRSLVPPNPPVNSTPLAPLGTNVIVYEPKPQRISTWSDCG